MAAADALAEAAQLEERRDLGNIPRDPVSPPEPDESVEAAPEADGPADEPASREDGDAAQLRTERDQLRRELELARAAYRQPAPPPPPAPSYTADNILPVQVSEDVLEGWGLPRQAAGQINDLLKVVALAAKNAALQEAAHAYTAVETQKAQAQQMRARFYGEHKDLEPHAAYVGYVAQQVKAQHPQAPESLLLPYIADEARKQLKASGLLKAPRRRRPAASDSPGSAVGARPNGKAHQDYNARLLERL